jgi:hypothetical protein
MFSEVETLDGPSLAEVDAMAEQLARDAG